mmetsp:Transcript_11283/g.40013  ORF Transcript_11283/g.40013 Transcript_11283/m.40013 type:complete len:296 (+) Transcript_11283:32-919(+)
MDPDLRIGILSNCIGVALLFGVASAMHLTLLAAVALAINWVVFVVHAMPQNSEKFFDATGSITYLCLVGFALASSHTHGVRQIVDALLVTMWCVRLGSFLLARILRDGKDSRFDELKKTNVRFLGIWTIQSVWCFFVASPALVVITSSVGATALAPLDFVGWGMWLTGFVFEVVADKQKEWFRDDLGNKGRFITSGLWAYSRHPNYFGEITMWVGICISSSGCFHGFEWLAWLSPLTTWVLLLKVSGVPALEAKGQQTWGEDPAYNWYLEHTPCIIPATKRPPAFQATDYVAIVA